MVFPCSSLLRSASHIAANTTRFASAEPKPAKSENFRLEVLTSGRAEKLEINEPTTDDAVAA
jgi:hypothetical protein